MENNFTIWTKRILLLIGGAITTILGGWDMLLKTLVGLVIADYILGVTAAGINSEVNSRVGFKGIFKKVMLFVPVGVAYSLDQVLESEILRNMAIWFYIGNEGISIIENLSKAGVPFPNFVKELLVQLKESSDKGEMIK
ncbi:phage holin family protein [Tissierella praeacuta]|uniref:phage holin family protein n=1 Tax=Tissierella praeacuta TaxID=43131 RepID=UPI002FD8B7D0